jgi:hypothetical protein
MTTLEAWGGSEGWGWVGEMQVLRLRSGRQFLGEVEDNGQLQIPPLWCGMTKSGLGG